MRSIFLLWIHCYPLKQITESIRSFSKYSYSLTNNMNNQHVWPVFSLSSFNAYLIITNICIVFTSSLLLGSVCVWVRSGFHFPWVHSCSVICTEFQMPLYCFCVLAQRALVKCLLPVVSTHTLIRVLLSSWTCYPSNLLVIVKPLLGHLFSSQHLPPITVTRTRHNILLVITAVSKHVECFYSVCASFHVQGGH